MPSDKFNSVLDRATLATDLVKHISTLASGSIVVLATFLSRVDVQGKGLDKTTLIETVVLLMICILCCSAYLFFFGIRKTWTAQQASALEQHSLDPKKSEIVLSALIFLTFSAGIVFLGLYAVKSFGVGQ
jgi:hypothetical protein